MAELLLKVRDSSGYNDGDILCAFSRRSIEYCHCHRVCHERHPIHRRLIALDNSHGLILPDNILWDYCSEFYEYRFDRLSRYELEIVRLSDNQSVRLISNRVFYNPFSDKYEQMDVDMYVTKQVKTLQELNARGQPIFKNEYGWETWFGGKQAIGEHARVIRVWDKIEYKTGKRRLDAAYRHYPLGIQDVKSHLPMAVKDFDDIHASVLVEPEIDLTNPNEPIILRKRKHYVDWRSKLSIIGVSESDVLNKNAIVDKRATMNKLATNMFINKRLPISKIRKNQR